MRPYFFVDGDTEAAIVPLVCDGVSSKDIKKISGGYTVSPAKMAEEVAETLPFLIDDFDVFIILTDLDRRAAIHGINDEQFETQFKEAFNLLPDLPKPENLIIGVANREFENWLYSSLTAENHDGEKCINFLSGKLGEPYRKGSYAQKVLLHADHSLHNALASPSFARFAQKLPPGLCPKLEGVLGE